MALASPPHFPHLLCEGVQCCRVSSTGQATLDLGTSVDFRVGHHPHCGVNLEPESFSWHHPTVIAARATQAFLSLLNMFQVLTLRPAWTLHTEPFTRKIADDMGNAHWMLKDVIGLFPTPQLMHNLDLWMKLCRSEWPAICPGDIPASHYFTDHQNKNYTADEKWKNTAAYTPRHLGVS